MSLEKALSLWVIKSSGKIKDNYGTKDRSTYNQRHVERLISQ